MCDVNLVLKTKSGEENKNKRRGKLPAGSAQPSVLNLFPFRKFNRSFVTGIPLPLQHSIKVVTKDKPFWLDSQGCHYSHQLFMICMVQLIVTQRANRKWSKLIALKRSSNGCREYRSEEACDNTSWNKFQTGCIKIWSVYIRRIKFQTSRSNSGNFNHVPKINTTLDDK